MPPLDSPSSNTESTPTSNDDQVISKKRSQSISSGGRKKKRSLGVFPCTHCDKVFTRSDHLARHNLNHEPKEVYVCDFVMDYHGSKSKCGKTFVRKDLKERHIKRHYELTNLEKESDGINNKALKKRKGSTSSNTSTSSTTGMHISNILDDRLPQPSSPAPPSHQQQSGTSTSRKYSIKPHASPQCANMVHQNTLPSQTQSNVRMSTNGISQNQKSLQNLSNSIPAVPTQQSSPGYQTTIQANNFVHIQNELNNFNNLNNLNNLNTLYKSYGTTIPQNDILSWLFNDSPQGNSLVQSSPETQQSMPRRSSQPLPSLQEQEVQSQVPLTSQFHPIPSPYGGSQFSPMADQIQSGLSVPVSSALPTGIPNYPFDMSAFSNGYGADANIFSTDDNPLDNILYKNYHTLQNSNQLVDTSKDDSLRSIGVSISSASPTNTVESSNDNTTENAQEEEHVFFNHREKNIPTNRHCFIEPSILNLMLQSIGVSRQDLPFDSNYPLEHRFSFYLYSYWKHFHSQFTILHKPSFDTKSAEPLLLIAMVSLGACYSFPENALLLAKESKKSAEFKFALQLAKPLRFSIFEHEDFKSPVKLWILQSLNMLEWVEKNFLTRRMHERAHLHHGTTAQLLRRSPLLGGNPTHRKKSHANSTSSSAGEESELEDKNNTSDTTDHDLFEKWVESEGMKRITFMTFYLDIIDFIKFRHNPQILFYQLQLLNLPCDDEHLWESTEVNGSFKKVVRRQRKLQDSNITTSLTTSNKKKKAKSDNFLAALKKILKSDKLIELKNKSIFCQKILLAGLISLMHQMQQSELQNSSSLLTIHNSNSNSKIWKEMLIRSFDNWNFEVMQTFKRSNNMGISMYSVPNSNVAFPIFYLTQIIGLPEINHYDIAIFAGSPANQSVDATLKDHFMVQQKLNNIWSKNNKNIENIRGIFYCYFFLWTLMIDENGNKLDWNPNCDYYDTVNAVSTATLVLWSYYFTVGGLESNKYTDGNSAMDPTICAEDGYDYLSRIMSTLLASQQSDKVNFGSVAKYCEVLQSIPNKQNISGLCFLMARKLMTSQWEVLREHAKLIFNCGYRSIGKRSVLCPDLFDNEFQ
ncbi:hypothetical protein MEK_03088 [Candida albicans 12C]|nr:hypothetical protein MEK_03088 [Candida albicans 12C]